MSDIPPESFLLPELPNDLLLHIFNLSDPTTVMNARMTSRYWRAKLSSHGFVTAVAARWRRQACSIVLHFCYPSSFSNSFDWVMMMDAFNRYTIPFHFPFLLTYEGWFHVIRIENGVLCIRYSSMGRKSYLVVWNAVTRRSRIIPDSVYVFQPEMVYIYAFVYYPNTLDYAIVHVYQHIDEPISCTLTMYTSFRRNWNVMVPCPSYVQRLDPTYVTLDGKIFWLTCLLEDVDRTSPFIVCFSIIDLTFKQIFVPQQAFGHCYTLLILNDNLYLASSTQDDEGFITTIWFINVKQEDPTWISFLMCTGRGPLFTLTIFVDQDIIQIKERHFEVEGVDDAKLTHFHIRHYTPSNNTRRTLHWVQYEDEVHLWSLGLYHETLYPV